MYTQIDGRWYVIATLYDNVASGHCNVVSNNVSNIKTVTCHAQAYVYIYISIIIVMYRSDGSCIGPQIFDVDLALVGHYNVSNIRTTTVYDVQEMPIDGIIVYQDDNYLALYGCTRMNADGSCVSDEESVAIVSRQRNVGAYIYFMLLISRLLYDVLALFRGGKYSRWIICKIASTLCRSVRIAL